MFVPTTDGRTQAQILSTDTYENYVYIYMYCIDIRYLNMDSLRHADLFDSDFWLHTANAL